MNNKGVLTPGEISAGQFVTVLSNQPYEHQSQDFLGTLVEVKHEDRSGFGSLYRVESVQLPYVLTREYNRFSKKFEDHVTSRDMRRTTLMELTPDFVNQYAGCELVQKETV